MIPRERERQHCDIDQTASDADQSAADVDQTLADSDQSSSERDQEASDQDQRAANIDQATSVAPQGREDGPERYEQTRDMRADSNRKRGLSSDARGHTSVSRDTVARQRDEAAHARDLVSDARDELAATLDAEIERLDREHVTDKKRTPDGAHDRERDERRSAARSRARAAAQRSAAAADRDRAAHDRGLAALDRLAYRKELEASELDEVTGALCRRVGLIALQREMERTERSNELLTVVFIDVDGLKQVNDEQGHAAGDNLLRNIVKSIRKQFRSYDLIIRFGGDEFVCSLTGDGLKVVGQRLENVKTCLSSAVPGASISTGVSRRRPEDTIETLIERADHEMIATRQSQALPHLRSVASTPNMGSRVNSAG